MRVIAATNRDLSRMVAAGGFRMDLYYRLQVLPVRVPALRERRQDIHLLAFYFVARMAAHLQKTITEVAPEALNALETYDWPGNVRELEHAVKRAVVVCRGTVIRPEDIALGGEPGADDPGQRLTTLAEHERLYLSRVLDETGWVVANAAAILGLPPSTLRNRMRKLGIVRP